MFMSNISGVNKFSPLMDIVFTPFASEVNATIVERELLILNL